MRLCSLVLLLHGVLVSCAAAADSPRPELPGSLPVVVLDVDFNRFPVGLPPQKQSKEQIEAADAKPFWSRFPIRTCDELLWLTRTRRAVVAASAYGLEDKPLVLTCEASRYPQYYGPMVVFGIPDGVTKVARRYRLLLDVAKKNEARSGGFSLEGVASIRFLEDGSVVAGKVGIGRYQPCVPLHFEVILDVGERTATYAIDGHREKATTLPWDGASFRLIRFDGVLPGGYGEVPTSIAFDNIKLILEKTL